MALLLVVLAGFALVLPLVLLRGLVLSYFWVWFLVPLGLHPIGVAHAIGIALLVNVVTPGKIEKDDPDDKFRGFRNLAGHYIGTLLAWGVGYIVAGTL